MSPVKPSSRVTYALRALVDLALHQATGPVTVKAIAKRQGIPERYLEQLFNRLRRKGLILAERGPRGGYRLNRPAAEISVSEIFEVLESPSPLPSATKGEGADPSRTVWRQVERAIATTLQATTLEQLAAQASEQLSLTPNHRFTFHI